MIKLFVMENACIYERRPDIGQMQWFMPVIPATKEDLGSRPARAQS
jgi:hypothetical protein